MFLNDSSQISFCAIKFYAIKIYQQDPHLQAHMARAWPRIWQCAHSHLPHVKVRGRDANDAIPTVVDETYRRRVIPDPLLGDRTPNLMRDRLN